MRNYLYLLLFIVFVPAALLGQKKVEKKMAVWPVTVQTQSGTQTFQKPDFGSMKLTAQKQRAEGQRKQGKRPVPSGRQMDEGGPAEATWTGDASSDWNDPANWQDAEVPGYNSTVYIDGNSYSNEPEIDDYILLVGLVMNNAMVNIYGGRLDVYNTVQINNSTLSGGYFEGHDLSLAEMWNSYFLLDVKLTISGEANLYANYFDYDVYIEDTPARDGPINIFGNEFIGSLYAENHATTLTMDEPGGNIFYIANGSNVQDNIANGLYVKNYSEQNEIYVGVGSGIAGEPLRVGGDVDVFIESNNNGLVFLDKITLDGGQTCNFSVHSPLNPGIRPNGPGPIAIEPPTINKLFVRKDYSVVNLKSDLVVNELLFLDDFECVVNSHEDAMLMIGKDCIVQDENPTDGIFVAGPMKKIGNSAFTFPIGEYKISADRVGNMNRTFGTAGVNGVYGSAKSPLSISAPAEEYAEFIAQFRRHNPNNDGYDTNVHDGEVENIFDDGYWLLNHARGISDVNVTLAYNQSSQSDPTGKDLLAITLWNGSSWTNVPKGDITGDDVRGTIASAAPLTAYGPLALHTGTAIRKPVMTITSPNDVEFCRGIAYNFKIYYTLDTAAMQNTQFKVELSDADGTFSANPQLLGYNTPDAHVGLNISDSISVAIPYYFELQQGGNYKLRIRTDKQGIISENTIPISQITTPQVTVSIVGSDDVCMDQPSLKYYPSEKEPGVNYVWTVADGTIVMDGDTAYITFTKAGNKSLKVTPTNTCGAGTPTTMTVNVKPGVPVSTPEITHTGRWLYASTAPAAEQVTEYNWYRDDVQISGINSTAYYAKDAGTYRVRYGNDCGESPSSNPIHFENAAVSQTITFPDIPDKVYNDDAFPLPAVSSSGLPVQYRLVSGPGTISEGIFAITGTGTVTVEAYQQGDDVYDTALHVTKTFVINKATQTINFPVIADPVYTGKDIYITLEKNTSAGLPITYQSSSPGVIINGNIIRVKDLGSVTITATQPGNDNYLAAVLVDQTFCVVVTDLQNIAGAQYVCPNQKETYTINNIPGLTYHWRLADGTTFASVTNEVEITWAASGEHKLYVSAIGSCGQETAVDSLVVAVMDAAVTPTAVTNMFPSDGTGNVILPAALSWVPGANSLAYDIYIWDEGSARPATPAKANVTTISYNISKTSGLIYGNTYNWQVVAKNGCLVKDGPVQTFTLREAADLTVTEINTPTSANSGQKITISWKVKNIGAGNTLTNEAWNDAVFLSFDTEPNFQIPPEFKSVAWNQAGFPLKPLLVGTKQNIASLNVGEEYTNSVDFDIPMSYGQPLYVYVITNYKGGNNAPPDRDYSNDTSYNATPIDVHMTPTPDVRVETVFTPASTFSGSTINVTYQVKNYGAIVPGGSGWMDNIYMSKNPIFNKNDATLLKLPKANGTYYPNAQDAQLLRNDQLIEEGTITYSQEVVVPNFIQGTWFVHVVANETGGLYEGALGDNNDNSNAIQVFLTPTPQLAFTNVTASKSDVSPGEQMDVNWNLTNSGSYDNIEKNKGFYPYILVKDNPDYTGPVRNCAGCPDHGSTSGRKSSPTLRWEYDSLSFGNSRWNNKIYLSTDPNGLNTANAIYLGETFAGQRYPIPEGITTGVEHEMDYGTPPHTEVHNPNTNNVLRQGANFIGNFSFIIPTNVAAGDYYVYVAANTDKSVFTYPDVDVTKRSRMVSVRYPDLTVQGLTVPSSVQGGIPFVISYKVQNNGQVAMASQGLTDQIYMSDKAVLDGTEVLLTTQSEVAYIPHGFSTDRSVTITLPYQTSGIKYFFVKTNAGNVIRETTYANNTAVSSGGVSASYATLVDLAVEEIETPANLIVPGLVVVNYTVKNTSGNSALGSITDRVYFGCTADFGSAINMGSVTKARNLVADDTYKGQVAVDVAKQMYLLSNCFAKGATSTGYIFVETNSNDGVYESGGKTNNVISIPVTFANNGFDLSVDEVTGDESGSIGRSYNVTWQVSNQGQLDHSGYDYHDGIYFSPIAGINEQSVPAGYRGFGKNASFPSLTSRSSSLSVTIPKLAAGDYYVVVVSDYNNNVKSDLDRSNNINFIRDESDNPKKIHIDEVPLSDLQIEILSAPASVAGGQPVTVKYRITNHGTGDAYPSSWLDRVGLSKGVKINTSSGDKVLGSVYHKAGLTVGASYTDSITYTIPTNQSAGNYMLIAEADYNNNVIEEVDTNNLALQPIMVYIPDPSDLIVENVTAPSTVYLGYPIENIGWKVKNISGNNAEGVSTDGVYLSKNPVWDSTAVLIGLKKKSINLSPLGVATYSEKYVVDNVPEGEYYIIIRADIQNNILETDKTNNEGATSGKIYVSVKELKLGQTLTESTQEPKYYRLNIPDSLLGATVLVTLESDKYLTQWNELYAGGGYIPSVIRNDYKFDKPNYGNQQLLLADITDTVYYIAVMPVSANKEVQQIQLHAEVLPFAIVSVNANTGGNGGNVTVRLTGSLFTPYMQAKLKKGIAEIEATAIHFVNSTTAYATFPLLGKDIGVYDVVMTKPDESEAVLANGFSVVSPDNGGLYSGGGVNTGQTGYGSEPGCDPGALAGKNSQLGIEMVIPEKVFAGWVFPIQINYTNPTNMDIPIQTLIIFNDYDMPMALSKEDLPKAFTQENADKAKSSLYIELAEKGGVPGIIRAGGSGTITLYSISAVDADAHKIVHFELK